MKIDRYRPDRSPPRAGFLLAFVDLGRAYPPLWGWTRSRRCVTLRIEIFLEPEGGFGGDGTPFTAWGVTSATVEKPAT